AVAYRPGGRELVVLDRQGTVKVWDARTGRVGLRLPAGPNALVALRPDGLQAATADGARVRLFAVDTGDAHGELAVGAGLEVRQIDYTADSKRIVTISAGRRQPLAPVAEVAVWELSTRQARRRLTTPLHLHEAVALSRGGRWAAALLTDTVVR